MARMQKLMQKGFFFGARLNPVSGRLLFPNDAASRRSVVPANPLTSFKAVAVLQQFFGWQWIALLGIDLLACLTRLETLDAFLTFLTVFIWFCGSLLLLLAGVKKRKMLRLYKKWKAFSEGNFGDISEFIYASGLSSQEAEQLLQGMIGYGFFGSAFLEDGSRLVRPVMPPITEAGPAASY